MKKQTLILSALLMVGTITAKAQNHEVKTNVLGHLFNNHGLTYEYGNGENFGLQATTGFFNSFTFDDGDYDLTAFYFIPEAKFYLRPEDGSDGFYISGYLKYRHAETKNETVFTNDGSLVEADRTSNSLAAGFNVGKKIVNSSNFVFEWYFGIGRYFIDEDSYSEDIDESYFDDFPKWDVRLGVSVGWRF